MGDNDSFDEDLAHFCQQALFVQPPPRLIDLDTVPADGNEFIQKSRLEDALLNFGTIELEDETKSPDQKVPNKVNKDLFRKVVADFCFLVNELQKYREKIQKKYQQVTVLPLQNEKQCCKFCLENKPLLNFVIHLKQSEILKLLKFSFRWYQNIGMVEFISMWIFALFACLKKPLTDEQEEFLEKFYDVCKEDMNIAEGDELMRLCLISSLLEFHFCVKYSKFGGSINKFL